LGTNKNNSIINIYPNPSCNDLNISGKIFGSGVFQITVSDISGRTVIQENVFVNSNILDETFKINNLQNGIYFLNIKSDKESYVMKFIKE